uniref:Uncharacterized protein n=1 Tax=Oryza meridionalis TaxID=40149 RepID=A0A0E0DQ41_9ORYZ
MAVAGREMSCRAIVTGMVVDAAEAECQEFEIEAEPKEQHSCCMMQQQELEDQAVPMHGFEQVVKL